MAINWAKIPQTHLLKDQTVAIPAASIRFHQARAGLQGNSGEGAFETFLSFVRELQCQLALGQLADETLEILGQLVVRRVRDELVKIRGDGANVFGDAPLVV